MPKSTYYYELSKVDQVDLRNKEIKEKIQPQKSSKTYAQYESSRQETKRKISFIYWQCR